jgi:hypothetical protein
MYINDRGGARMIRSGAGPARTSILSLMGFGGDGMGDFNDETPCSNVPAGDPYRKPGNYCATPGGGYTTFNADGSTYMDPSTGAAAAAPSPSIWDRLGSILSAGSVVTPMPGGIMPPAYNTGMSTTTKVALAGGAVLLLALIARK